MKALLIADDENVISNTSEVLKTAGYEVIVYRWLLKALDNIEEISPHLIVISTEDYPRHWKIVTQFAAFRFGDYLPQVILYTGKGFDEEEEKKAEALKVRGTFSSVDVEGLDTLREILTKNVDIYSGKLTDYPLSEKFSPVTESLTADEEDEKISQTEEIESKEEEILPEKEITEDNDVQAKETNEPEQESVVSENEAEQSDTVSENVIEEDISDSETNFGEEDLSVEDRNFSEDSEEIDSSEEISIPVPDESVQDESEIEDNEVTLDDIPDEVSAESEIESPVSDEKRIIPCSFLFTNPQNGALVSGVARNYDGEKLEFTPDLPSLCESLSSGTIIENASISQEGSVTNISAEVLDCGDFLTIQVKKSA